MKRKIATFVVFVVTAILACAQQPEVSIAVNQTTSTTISVSFDKNDVCTRYHILADTEEGMNRWSMMFGLNLETLVMQWGIQCAEDTSYTWREMTPNTPYVVYVVALSSDDTVLVTADAPTPFGGGNGVSTLTIAISEIGDTSARVVVTPDTNTALFKDMIIEKTVADTMQEDSLLSLLQNDAYTYYETDDWLWTTLDPNTCYYVMAVGQNGQEEWGQMVREEFCTTGSGGPSGFDHIQNSNIKVYPNPTTDVVNVSGMVAGSRVFMYNELGRVVGMFESVEERCSFDVSGFPRGVYFISTISSGKITTTKLLVQ